LTNNVIDKIEGEHLLGILDGLPLAIAQAGAYLQESGVGIKAYIKFYEQQWKELMRLEGETEAPLQDYPDRSIWTTWVISYNAVREKHESTANLLLLWSLLNNKDLWYGLFTTACQKSTTTKSNMLNWIGSAASSELEFSQAIRLLRSYSLVEEVEAAASYSMHPVVHKWAYHYQSQDCRKRIGRLAVMVVGWAVPSNSTRDYSAAQRRLLPHVQACSRYVVMVEPEQIDEFRDENKSESKEGENNIAYLDGIHLLGLLYADQGKLDEAEKMYMRALQGKEALGQKHTSTLNTVNNLGALYADQGKRDKAEKMYMRALQGCEEALGSKHTLTLDTVNNLGNLYNNQGKQDEAKKMYMRALQGYEEALGPKHTSTLNTVNNLGLFYADQGKRDKAEKMYMRALQGCEEALGLKHISTLDTVHNLGALYADQGKWDKAEKMYMRALQGYEEALGLKHTSTLDTVHNLGALYADQGKRDKAEKMYMRALQGYEEALDPDTVARYRPALNTLWGLGDLFAANGEKDKVKVMYTRSLNGFEALLGSSCDEYRRLTQAIASLEASKGNARKDRSSFIPKLVGKLKT
jgi:tetratricopeptide (TPR) repeat protein